MAKPALMAAVVASLPPQHLSTHLYKNVNFQDGNIELLHPCPSHTYGISLTYVPTSDRHTLNSSSEKGPMPYIDIICFTERSQNCHCPLHYIISLFCARMTIFDLSMYSRNVLLMWRSPLCTRYVHTTHRGNDRRIYTVSALDLMAQGCTWQCRLSSQ